MAIEVIAKVMEYDLPPREKYVLMLYANYSNPEGQGVWPSQSTMAMISGYSRKTINEVTKTLNDCTLLVPDGRTKHNTLNWTINTKWKGTKQDVESVTKGLQTFEGVTPSTQVAVTPPTHNTLDDTPVKKIKKGIVAGMVELQGKQDPLATYPVDVIDYLREYIKASNHQLIPSEKAAWIKEARKWRELGAVPADVPSMYAYAVSNWDVAQPRSITSAYNMMKTKRHDIASDIEKENQRLKELHG